jgi:hypothetical protein
MRVDVSRRVGGVRLLLKKSSPEPMNKEDMRKYKKDIKLEVTSN